MTFKQFKFYIQANWIRSIYFNFKLFPFKQAVKMPILLFGKCDINIGQNGKIKFDSIKNFASMIIGNSFTGLERYNSRNSRTYISICGTINVSGVKQAIGNGCKIVVDSGAELILGDHVVINNLTKIACQKKISIGDLSSISWECQIFDTNFHYIVNDDGSVNQKCGIISIGKSCWIGNRCTIQKNTVLGDYCTLASNSVINKDYSSIENGTFAGSPAKMVARGKIRVRNACYDRKLDEFFLNHKEIKTVYIDLDESKKYFSNSVKIISK